MTEYNLNKRFQESIKSNYDILDLSHLNLTTFPFISNEFKVLVKHLFVTDNYLKELPHLNDFKNLQTLDVSFNEIYYW